MDPLFHALHLLAATFWVGGLIFTSGVLSPVLRRDVAAPLRVPLVKAVGQRFSKFGRLALLLLVVTGLYRVRFLFFISPGYLWTTLYGKILSLKLGLFLGMLVLSFLHDGVWGPRVAALTDRPHSPEFRQALRRLTFWARLNVAIVGAIVLCAATLRFTPR